MPSTPYYMRYFQVFDKIDSFLKNGTNGLGIKKGKLDLWRTAYNFWLTFFLFRCGFQEKIEPSCRNYLIWTAGWGGWAQYPRYTEYSYYFLISNSSNASHFLNWRWFLLYFWLQEFIKLQTEKVYKRAINYSLYIAHQMHFVQLMNPYR